MSDLGKSGYFINFTIAVISFFTNYTGRFSIALGNKTGIISYNAMGAFLMLMPAVLFVIFNASLIRRNIDVNGFVKIRFLTLGLIINIIPYVAVYLMLRSL